MVAALLTWRSSAIDSAAPMTSRDLPVFHLCAALVLGSAQAQAQEDPPRYEPPVLRPEQQGLSLVDAVRLTLQGAHTLSTDGPSPPRS